MGEKLLTIVVPAYNVEEYLKKCVDSVIATAHAADLEVIIVDDGSTDMTPQIADAYAEANPGIVRVIHKVNGGHGSAINTGIRAATGLYLRVLDGDDWVEVEALDALAEKLRTADEDVIVTRYTMIEDATERVMPEDAYDIFHHIDCDKPYTFGEIAELPYIRIHQLNYRTSLLQEHEITIDEKCFYVDVEFALFPMPFVRTLRFYDLPVYRYRIGRPKQSMSIGRMQKYVADHSHVLDRIFDFYDRVLNEDTSNALLRYLEYELARLVVTQTRIWLSFPPAKEYKQKIRELGERVKKDYPPVNARIEKRAVRFLFRFKGFGYRPISWVVRKAYGVKNG